MSFEKKYEVFLFIYQKKKFDKVQKPKKIIIYGNILPEGLSQEI